MSRSNVVKDAEFQIRYRYDCFIAQAVLDRHLITKCKDGK